MSTRILLIACDDARGLVSKVTGILYQHDCNIIENGEYVDLDGNRFYMRTEFEGEIDGGQILGKLREVLPGQAEVRLVRKRKKKVVVLATREAHCLGDLLIRCTFNDMNAELQGVVANHDVLRGLSEQFGLPFDLVSADGLERDAHEAHIIEAIEQYEFDYIVMAKYMRILSDDFIKRYANRIVNIHHSFLPAFIGANPYRQAYERGVKVIGATAHFATEQLDEGPIIAQGTIPVDHTHSASDMARAGRDVEKTVLARALHLVFEDRVFVHGNKTVIL